MVKRRLQANANAGPSRKGSNGSQGQPGASRTMAERVASYMNDPINPRKLSPDQDGMIITLQPPDYEGIEHDGKTQCVFLSKHEMSMLVEAPGYPRTLPRERTLGGYVIKHVEGKGLGMFATRDFAYGDMIASERPLLIFPMQLRTVETSRGDPDFELEVITLSEKVLEFALERMGEVNKKKFLALHNCRANEKDCPNLLGIWRTNSFGVEFKKGRGEPVGLGYSAVHADLSRINHSPNAHETWEPLSVSRQLFALRPIAKGEEITIHYIALDTPHEDRARLLSYYRFTCQCKACTDPTLFLNKLNAVQDGLPAIMKWLSSPVLPHDLLLKSARDVLALIEAENQQGHEAYPMALMHLACIHHALGDEEQSLQYMKKRTVWDMNHYIPSKQMSIMISINRNTKKAGKGIGLHKSLVSPF